MLFHNPAERALRFTIADRSYDVPPGAEVEIPDALAYVVKGRGMALAEGPAPQGDPKVRATVRKVMPPAAQALLLQLQPWEREGFDRAWEEADDTARQHLLAALRERVAHPTERQDHREAGGGEVSGGEDGAGPGAGEDLGGIDEAINKAAVAAGRAPKARAPRPRG